MIGGTIKLVDPARRIAIVSTEERGDLTVQFGPDATIEVGEPAVAGMRNGSLEDLGVGYQVELALDEKDGLCRCTALVCLS